MAESIINVLFYAAALAWVIAGSLALILWIVGAMSIGRTHTCCGCCDDKLDVRDASW